MITAQQQQLIDMCKAVGYGWGKFAMGVERSGNCSEKQEHTLRRMLRRIRDQRDMQTGRRRREGGTDHDAHSGDAAMCGYGSYDGDHW